MNETTRTCGSLTRTDGHPCRRPVAPGFTKCNLHGGHSPLARQAASETLAAAALPSARVPLEIVSRWLDARCDVCGCPTGDPMPALNAAKMVLDRTGFHPSVRIEQEPPAKSTEWTRWLTDSECEQMGEIIENAKQRMQSGSPLPSEHVDAPLQHDSTVVNGDVVPDDVDEVEI